MKRVLCACVFVFSVAATSFGQTTFYYPHVANGVLGGTVWKTTIFLTNPAATGTATASGTITFTKDDANSNAAGSPFTISFIDENGNPTGSGNTLSFQIAGGQSRKFTSTGTGTYAGGFATVTSNQPINGTAIFSEFDTAGRLIAEAGVPAGSAVTRQAIFVDTVGGFNVGVAFANPGTGTANVTLNLLNSSAVTVMTTTQTLGSGNHKAAFVTELFPGAPQLSGTMQIVSNQPLSAIALRFDPTFTVFTTLPPVTIASVMDATVGKLWAAIRATVVLSLGGAV
jgi:hypothetical protein